MPGEERDRAVRPDSGDEAGGADPPRPGVDALPPRDGEELLHLAVADDDSVVAKARPARDAVAEGPPPGRGRADRRECHLAAAGADAEVALADARRGAGGEAL